MSPVSNKMLLVSALVFLAAVVPAYAFTSNSGLYPLRTDQDEMLCDPSSGQCLCGYVRCPVEQMECSNGYCKCAVRSDALVCEESVFAAAECVEGGECECGVAKCTKETVVCDVNTHTCTCPDVFCPTSGLQAIPQGFMSPANARYACTDGDCACGDMECNSFEFSLDGGACACTKGMGSQFTPTTQETRNAWASVFVDLSLFETVAQTARDITSLVNRRLGGDE
eukprot:GDKI01014356.1.p2 GENE.GDKI01014356.1~~GDKI01014356.1.p2  ORF type:complete len:225 (+),score=77.02 GDKI01014356.1:99-773(+)